MRIGIDVGGTHTDAVILDDQRVLASTKTLTSQNVKDGVVNALDDYAHPMQMLADLQVMMEHSGVGPNGTLDGLQGAKFAFVGDLQNNVTYDLMRAGCIMGLEVKVAGPKGTKYDIEGSVLEECAVLSALSGAGSATVVDTAEEACAGADFVYADSWMSYGISQEARGSWRWRTPVPSS